MSICFYSCEKEQTYSEIPLISFNKSTVFTSESDNIVDFNFSITDGDGNFGLQDYDTIEPFKGEYAYNFHARMFAKENGVFTEKQIPFIYRIPTNRNFSEETPLKGEITIRMTLNDLLFPYDSIYFIYFVYDRKLNKSNTDTSSIIKLP